ncbi:MAG: DNA primase [Alphaproteobacteria bacterium]|nr:DNA primase [Alphaproteobacteria bacterium]
MRHYIHRMRYPPNLLDEILRRTDLVQLVGRRVKLIRKGRVMWGCCPFHKEKSPSFKVENERRTYHCFGCGAGGDAFKWLQETEGLTFPESVQRLAGEAGIELPKWSAEDEEREEKKKSLYDVVELAAQFYEEQLFARDGAEARDYLKSRGLDGAAAKQFRLGYAPGGNNVLVNHLTTKNVPLDDIIAAGLARPADENRGVRDFFFNRVMFTITDVRGRAIAFGARALDPDAKPKYINTGETQLFSKGHLLYNYQQARAAALKAGTIILAEGYMDVIALVRAGFSHAVAPLGTALTEDQLQLMWRVAPEPVLAFDGDEAGLRAGARAAHLALPHLKPGHSLRFAFLPPGEDPDSLLKSQGLGAMQRLLEAASPLADVLWRGETEGRDFSTPERRAGLERSLSEIVSQIGDRTIAEYYKRDFNDRVFEAFKRRQPQQSGNYPRQNGQRRQSGLGGGFRGGRRGEAASLPGAAEGTVSPAVKNSLLARSGRTGALRVKEMELAVLLLEVPELALHHAETLAALPFSDPILDRLRHELLNLAASGFHLEKRGLENHLVRTGLGNIVERLKARGVQKSVEDDGKGSADGDDAEARWLSAAAQLREMAELAPERQRAVERFTSEATEESWQAARRLLGAQND